MKNFRSLAIAVIPTTILVFILALQANAQSALFTSNLPSDSNCGGAQVDFTMDDETGVLEYEWNFGNGQAVVGGPYAGAGSTNASTTYITSGSYTAQLTINGSTTPVVETVTINIYDAPSPAFEATNETDQGCLNPNFTAEFDYTAATTDIVQWEYNFGDGSGNEIYTAAGGSNGDVTHQYSEPGTYNVFLTVTDVNGCTQFLFQPGIVTVSSTPVADFSVGTLSSGDLPISVNFLDASTDDEDAIAFYEWSVEKQSDPGVSIASSTDQDATIEFTEYDDYEIILTAIISPGECSHSVSKSFSLNENTVAFTPATNQVICIGTDVSFTNTSTDGNGSTMTYLWDFGDGNTSTDEHPTYAYSSAAGSPYEVTLTVDFSDGNQKTLVKSNFVTVYEALNATISADQQEGCEAFDVNFTASAGGVLYEWDFDYDGSTPNFTVSSASNLASHSYSTAGEYDILLQVTTASGCVEQVLESDFIQLAEPVPSFVIGVDEEEGCVGDLVNFDASGSTNSLPSGNSGIASYHWDFDNDGNDDDTGITTSYNYPSEGTYSVKLRIVTDAGCEAEVVYGDYVKRGLVPTAGFNIGQTDLCIGTEVDFTSTSTANAGSALLIDNVEWNFDDGTVVTGNPSDDAGLNTPSHTYEDDTEDDGIAYTVEIKVSSNGCEASTTQQLDINYPVASFSVSGDDFNCLNDSQNTTFDASASEGVEEYRWEFGDGSVEPASGYTTGTDPSTTYEYSTSGDFTATLFVKNNTNSCEHSATQEINVSIGTIGFTADVTELCYTSETVSFTNSSTTNTTGTTTYLWDFGSDASPASATGFTPPSVSYSSPGLKTITLTQTESHGCVRVSTLSDYIEAKGPVADFSFVSTNTNDAVQCLEPNQSMTYSNESTVFGTGISAVAWSWDFGDGASPATSSLEDPSGTPVTYSSSGQKTISLSVTDNEGCIHTVTKNTSVSVPDPLASFETDASSYCIITDASNKEVSITNNSSETVLNSIASWSWDFGTDASPASSTDENPTAIGYTSTGVKTITLIVTTTDGCINSTTKDITVYEANASFAVADATLDCAPQMATFTDTSNDVIAWEWDFGDQFGSTSTQQHPTHMYILPGEYEITLTTTSAGGCQQASTAETVTVDGPYHTTYDFTPNNGCIEDDPEVDFDVTGLVKVDKMQLDWGDGAPAFNEDNMIIDLETSVSTSHIYNHNGDIGTFTPILTLTDDLTQPGACGSYIFPAPDKVIISSEPVPSFSSQAIVGNGCEDVEIQFTDGTQLNGGLTDPRYPLTQWTWDFGDGGGSTEKNPRHAFTSDGTFTVTLTVATAFGCEASTTEDILVRPGIVDVTTANTQTVCSGDTPAVLDAATPTGGTGSYTYLWETSDNQTDWTDATGTNDQEDYTPAATSPSTETTIYFRRVITSGPCDFTSDNYAITTDVTSDGGSLSSDATECYGENEAILVLSGETGSIVKWQSSTTNAFAGEEVDIVNTTHTLTYTDLTTTTYYRAEVKNGVCNADYSAVATITVLPDFTGNVIGADIVSCEDAAAASITATAPGGSNGNFTYQWQKSSDNSTFTDIGGATSNSYSPGTLITDTWFRRIVISDGNCETTSGSLKVEVSPLPIAGPDQTTTNSTVAMAADDSDFRASDGGNWTTKTKPAAATPNISTPTSPTSDITNLIPGDYTFTWTVDNGTCTMSEDVDVTIEPLIQINVSPASVDEDGATDLVYTFTSNGAISTPLTINFDVDGTATYNTDINSDDATTFSNTSGTVTLPASSTSVDLNVTPEDDLFIEGDETLELTVVAGTRYGIDTPAAATGTIADDDDDDVRWILTKDRDGIEGGQSLRYRATLQDASANELENQTGSNLSVKIDFTMGTAISDDFTTSVTQKTININNGSASNTRALNIDDDLLIELSETITAILSDPSIGSITTGAIGASVIDNDAPELRILTTQNGVEGGNDIEYNVKLVNSSGTDLTNETGASFTGTIAFSNSADLSDLTESSFPTTFSIADATGSTTYSFDPIVDTSVEFESLTATISAPVDNNGITPSIDISAATATIDDDVDINIAWTQDGDETGPVNVQYTVNLTGAGGVNTNDTGSDITVDLTFSDDAVAADVDPASFPSSIAIPDGSSSALIDLVVNDDLLVEGDENLNAEISNPTTGVSLGTSDADAIIADNDDAAVVKVDVEWVQDGEEDGTVPVQFRVKLHDGTNPLTNATGIDITVDIAFITGSETAQADFSTTFASLTPVAIADGESSVLISLNVVDDLLIEEDELIRATISNPTGATIDAASADADVIDDDDDNVHIKITTTQDGVEGGDNVKYEVTLTDSNDRNGNDLTNATGTDFTADIAFSDATQADFNTTLPTDITIADGSSTVELDFDALVDTNVEIEELIATITNEAHATVPVAIVIDQDDADIDDDAVLEIVKTQDGAETGPVNIIYTIQLTDGAGTDYFNTSGAPITADVSFSGNAETTDITGGLGSTTVSIASGGDNDQTLTLTVIDDAVLEIDESITATISNASSGVSITSTAGLQSAEADLVDNDTASITISDETETESSDLEFTLTLTNDVEGDVSVDVSFGGGDAETNDYVEGTQSFTFTGGTAGTKTVTVGTTDDGTLELDETFTASLTLTGGNSEVDDSDTGEGTITDDDDATVTINDADNTEGSGIVFDLDLSSPVEGNVVIDIDFTNVTTEAGDFTATQQQVTFTSGSTATQQITVATSDDALLEIDETFTASLSLNSGHADVVVSDEGTGTITDGDDATVTISDATVTEGGDLSFDVILDKNVDGNVVVDVSFVNVSTTNDDYVENTQTVTFSGGTAGTETITVGTTDDGLLEIDETFTAQLALGTGNVSNEVDVLDTGAGEIVDNESADADLSVTQHGNEAGPVDIVYTVTLSKVNNTGSAITFDIDDDLTGTASSGNDYTAIAGGATISVANGSDTGTLTVVVTDDALLEADTETVDATISNASNGDITITTPSATANITDNDAADAVLSVTQHGNEAGPVDIVYTVTLSKVNNTGTAITFDIDDELLGTSTATNGDDYTSIAGAATITIANGSSTGTLTVVVTDDSELEDNIETMSAIISNASNTDVTITTPSATANITDNDAADADLSVTQHGNEVGPVDIVYTVTLSKVNNTGTAITFDIDDDLTGTASSGNDYTAIAGGATISVANGSDTGTLTVVVTNDALLEADTETVDATISNASNGDITITTPSATANITDNDAADADLSVTQHGNEAGPVDIVYTVTLSKVNNTGSAITFDIDDELLGTSTATNGDDYTSIAGAATITIANGSSTGTLTVVVIDDSELEDNIETMSAIISNASNTDVTITTPSATANISDDDSVTASLSVLTHGDETGPVNIVFRMTLSKANDTGSIITADFSDLGTGTATSGSDYTAIAGSAQIAINIGATTGDITVTVTDDMIIESVTETLIAQISNISEADVSIITASATANIEDNDTPPFVEPESVSESTTEDIDLAFSTSNSNEILITDVDEDLQDVTITITNGILTLTEVGGVTIVGNGTASITVEDVSLTNINTALEGCIFSPTEDYFGAATITVTTLDPKGGTDTDVINIDVTTENDPPVANDDLGNIEDEDTAIAIALIGDNDTDVDGNVEPSSISLIDPDDASNTGNSSTPLVIDGKGSYTVDTNGNVTFTPEDEYNGDASINYTIEDNEGALSNVASIGITISPVQDPPVAIDDTATTAEDTPVTISPLSNDFDVDDDVLTITSATPDEGTVVINSNGTITLTPPEDFLGTILITYEISDGNGGTDTAIITVTITNDRSVTLTLQEVCVNDVPYVDYEISPVGFTPTGLAQIDWVKSDNEVAETLGDQPLSGRLLWPGAETDENGNGINWPGWNYTNSEWVQVEDGLRNGMSIRVSVNPELTLSVSYPAATDACAADPNNPPEAEDLEIEVQDEYVGSLESLVSDPDIEDELTFTTEAIEEPANGVVIIEEDGTFTYTPFVGFIGEDTFVYEVCDNSTIMACTTATVTITVLEGEQEATVLNTVISSTSAFPYDRLQIEDIENFPDNTVKVFNRWGNVVWEIEGYDNRENAFSGVGNGGGVFGSSGKLPIGTYFYVIDLGRGRAPLKGFVRIQ
ncbi:MAG: PKD domain-containing protein [Reichenbachiella sp.]|uniref:PKD domain-containing protein n=1 Tax=Reichenbachiella sp. TaxID=2184521 RepID=UPI003265BB57